MADLSIHPPDTVAGYETDFHAWAFRQAALLREGRLSELDSENLAEEIETLGRSVQRELRSRLQVLLLHLLKWKYQQGLRGASWQLTIIEQRRALKELLEESPSLHSRREQAMFDAYSSALRRAEFETGYPSDVFPSSCPFTFEQTMDDAFWPEPA